MKKRYAILLSSVYMFSYLQVEALAELNCTETPDCASLGYTMSTDDCKNLQHAKCPSDSTKVFCKKHLADSSNGTSRQINPVTCAVGSIIAGNGSCYAEKLPEGISPAGIVFDTTNRLAVAVSNIMEDGSAGDKAMSWSTVDGYDSGITNCSDEYNAFVSPESCAIDGRTNTNIMLKATGGGTYTAAQAVNKYEPAGCTAAFCKKTKWFIPSIKEWRIIYKQRYKVDVGLVAMLEFGAVNLVENYYHSSNENHNGKIYRFSPKDGGIDASRKTYSGYLRPVVKY